MVWGAGTGVFNLPSSSGHPTDSIIHSPGKAGVFPSFSGVTSFLAYPPSSPPYDWSLLVVPKLAAYHSFDLLAFAFVLYGIKPKQCCISSFSSSLAVTFLEKPVWRNCLAEEGVFPQCAAKRMILHVQEWENYDISRSIMFRTFQNHVPNKIAQCYWIWPRHLLCVCTAHT